MNILKSCVVLCLVLGGSGCATVGPGQVGVLWRASGGTEETPYGEGRHPVAKWNKLYVYDLKIMNQDETITALAVNGLSVTLGTSLRYRLVRNDILDVHLRVGQDYYQKLVKPALLSQARRILAQYTPEQIYSSKRAMIEREVREALNTTTGGHDVVFETFLIREVELPVAVRAAIDAKLVSEQQLQQMQYTLAITRAAADQKQIEAQGVAAYNNTVKASLSTPLLDYERIRGLQQLARSPNAKSVVIGSNTPVTIESPR